MQVKWQLQDWGGVRCSHHVVAADLPQACVAVVAWQLHAEMLLMVLLTAQWHASCRTCGGVVAGLRCGLYALLAELPAVRRDGRMFSPGCQCITAYWHGGMPGAHRCNSTLQHVHCPI